MQSVGCICKWIAFRPSKMQRTGLHHLSKLCSCPHQCTTFGYGLVIQENLTGPTPSIVTQQHKVYLIKLLLAPVNSILSWWRVWLGSLWHPSLMWKITHMPYTDDWHAEVSNYITNCRCTSQTSHDDRITCSYASNGSETKPNNYSRRCCCNKG